MKYSAADRTYSKIGELRESTYDNSMNQYTVLHDVDFQYNKDRHVYYDDRDKKIYFFGGKPATPERMTSAISFDVVSKEWSSAIHGETFTSEEGSNDFKEVIQVDAQPVRGVGWASIEDVSSNDTDIATNASAISSNDDDISSLQSLVKSSGSEVQIGSDSNGVTISSSAVKVGGENLISKRSDGSVHIGKNSLVLKESGGRQQMWATDASGNSIDIDVTNGSRLLINGRDVEKSIDNVGALSAALGSVPAISADSQFTCGFGAGTHSDAYALSGGCASKISERVSVNAALATVINNQTGGTSDNLSARAGFTFRLGRIDDSPKVAAQKAAQLHDEVAKMREENAMLLARLQKLEQLASLQVVDGKGLASR